MSPARSTTGKRAATASAAVSAAATDATGATRSRRSGSREYLLRLYVAGETAKSVAAFANLKRICEEHLAGRYQIEVVDLLRNPALARGDQILALPAVVRQLPPPVKKIIGDFSNAERVLVGLDIRPLAARRGRR